MKKFSNLIRESKSEEDKLWHPAFNQVDWDEVFKPLVDHIIGNTNRNSHSEALFNKSTVRKLEQLIYDCKMCYIEDGLCNGPNDDFFFHMFDWSITNMDDFEDLLVDLRVGEEDYDVDAVKAGWIKSIIIYDGPRNDLYQDVKDFISSIESRGLGCVIDYNFRPHDNTMSLEPWNIKTFEIGMNLLKTHEVTLMEIYTYNPKTVLGDLDNRSIEPAGR